MATFGSGSLKLFTQYCIPDSHYMRATLENGTVSYQSGVKDFVLHDIPIATTLHGTQISSRLKADGGVPQ